MQKCDINKVAKQLYSNRGSTVADYYILSDISNFRYLAANLKLSAEDFNFLLSILISARGFESRLED